MPSFYYMDLYLTLLNFIVGLFPEEYLHGEFSRLLILTKKAEPRRPWSQGLAMVPARSRAWLRPKVTSAGVDVFSAHGAALRRCLGLRAIFNGVPLP